MATSMTPETADPEVSSHDESLRLLDVSPASADTRDEDVPTRVKPSPLIMTIGLIITALGVFLVGFLAYVFIGSAVLADRTQAVLFEQLDKQLTEMTAPVARPIEPGAPLGILRIDRLGRNNVFVSGATGTDLAKGPGLRSDSVLPGQQGVAIIEGRRVAYGGPFRDLDQLSVGDRIVVTTGQGEFEYTVTLVRRSGDTPVAPATSSAQLVLITSDPPLTPTTSLYVTANLTRGTAQPATQLGLPIPSEQPLSGNTAAALTLALWSQALVFFAIGVALLWRRIPPVVMWVGGIPIFLALLWCVYGALTELLPNTL